MENGEQINLLLEEVAPDEWDLQLIANAERDNDGATATFEEMLKKDGLTYADLRD
ncbi:MAG: hypothetical protein K2J04_03500 [Lachnospiraceae bacterium]|nr:hypothetical protein [Lachnospiraceae bacterium]